MSPDEDEDWWDFEVPEPELTVTEPGVVGVLYDHLGRPLVVVTEERQPFGFHPGRVDAEARPKRKGKKRKRKR